MKEEDKDKNKEDNKNEDKEEKKCVKITDNKNCSLNNNTLIVDFVKLGEF